MGAQPPGSRAREAAAWLAPAAVGVGLRIAGLDRQILGGDELHAVRAAVSMPVSEILTRYRETDHSIPLTALYRLAMDAGLVLSELELRLPILLASALLLVLAPRWLGGWTGVRRARVWAWLLATSPMLVLYGRMVRSYGVVLLLTVLALLAFYGWWRGARLRAGFAYALLAAAALWFHLGAGPIVAAPLVWALLESVGARSRGSTPARSPRELMAIASAFTVCSAALLLPARESLVALVAAKSGAAGASLGVVVEVVRLGSGTLHPLAALAFWLVAALGALRLLQAQPELGRFTVCLVLGQIVGLAALAPKLDSPILASRAVLVVLPWVLLWLAYGIDACAQGLGRVAASQESRSSGRRFAWTAGLVAMLFALGPLASARFWRSSFQHHDDVLAFSRPLPTFESSALPAFYGTLESDRAGVLIEYPWHPSWGFGHAVHAYQAIHGHTLRVSNAEPFARDPRIRWRNFVPYGLDALLSSDGRYFVVHLDPEREEALARESMGPLAGGRPRPREWASLRQLAANAKGRFELEFGPPDHRDPQLWVWDLARLRGREARQVPAR